MKEKDSLKKFRSKAGSGMIFIAACFVAAFILFEFHDNYIFVGVAAVLLLLSAYLFLNALFEDKAKEWGELKEEEDFPGKSNGEFRTRVLKHIKESEATQKEMLATMNKRNEILAEQIENLEHEIYMLSEKQLTQTKTLIRFNKENARQLALNERENVENAVQELKSVLNGAGNADSDFVGFTEEDTVNDEIFLGEESFEEPEAQQDIIAFDLPEDFGLEDSVPEEMSNTEKVEPAENEDFTMNIDGTMSPDDIAKLLGNAEN